jgi:uncharacterized membrane-anchored protein
VLFSGVILVPAVGYRRFHWNAVFAFWFAYVVTRPLGASVADWMGKPKLDGGLGWGQGSVSLVLTALIVGFVWYLAVSRKDVTRTRRRRRSSGPPPDPAADEA